MNKKMIAIAAMVAGLASATAYAEGVYVQGGLSHSTPSWSNFEDKSETGFNAAIGYQKDFGKLNLATELEFQNRMGSLVPSAGSKIDLESHKSLNLKLGYQVTPKINLYGKAGVGSLTAKENGFSADGDTVNMGAGLSYDITKNVSILGEYRHTKVSNTLSDLSINSFNAGAMYRF